MKTKKKGQNEVTSYLWSYYCEELYRLFHSCKRSHVFYSALIAVKHIELFILSFSTELKQLVDADVNFQFIEDLQLIDYMERDSLMSAINNILIGVNVLILFSLAISFINYVIYINQLNFKQQSTRQKLNVNYQIEETLNDRANLFRKAFSLLITIYYYAIYVPCIFFSFQDTPNPIAITNVTIAIILNLLISDCDYNYEIKNDDYLSRPFSYAQLTLNSIIEILIFLAISFVPNGKGAILGAYYLTSAFISYFSSQYYKDTSQFVNTFIHIYLLTLSLVTEIGISFRIPNQLISYFVVIYFPLCYKLTQYLMERANEEALSTLQACLGDGTNLAMNLDRVIRLNLFDEIVDSRKNERREVSSLNLIINSNINFANSVFEQESDQNVNLLQKMQQFQCVRKQVKMQQDEMSQQTQSVDDVTASMMIQQRIKQILKEQFKKNIRDKRRNKQGYIYQLIIYFLFLIELAESPRVYYLQYLELSQNKLLSTKQRQIFLSIHGIFLKKRAILRKTLGRQNPFDCSYIEVIVFEKRLEQSYILLDSSIKLKMEILNIMKQKIINVTEMITKIENMQSLMQNVRKNLNSLCLMNDDSVDLLNLQALYLENLAFNEKDINLMQINKYRRKHQAILRHRYLNRLNDDDMNSSSMNNDRFDERTCILFASYKDPKNFIISSVSQNFQDIFYFTTNQDILGNNIEALIPFAFQPLHGKYLEQYIDEQITSHQSQFMLYNANNSSINEKQDAESILLNDNAFNKNKNAKNINSDQQSKNSSSNNYLLNMNNNGCRMNQQIIFASISPLFILPVRIDIRTNRMFDNEQFGLTAKIKHINDQYEYLLFDERNLHVLGLTEKLHFTISPYSESLSKINLKKIFPFLSSLVEQQQQQNNYQQSNNVTDKVQEYHVNLTIEMEDALRDQRLKKAHKKKIVFVIIQPEDMKNTFITAGSLSTMSKKSPSLKKSFRQLKSVYSKTDLSSYNFTFVEFALCKVKSRGIENISYFEITKLRQLNPVDQASFILSQIKCQSRQPIYEQYFPTFQEYSKIISELEQKVALQNQQIHILPSQNSSSLQAISALNNYLYPSNNQISTTGSSINQLLPLQQNKSQDMCILNDDGSNLEQVKIKSSNLNMNDEQNIIKEMEEDEGSMIGNDGYNNSIDKKEPYQFAKKSQKSHKQNKVEHQNHDYRQNSIEHNVDLKQLQSLTSQDQNNRFIHSIQEIQAHQDDPTIIESIQYEVKVDNQPYTYNNNTLNNQPQIQNSQSTTSNQQPQNQTYQPQNQNTQNQTQNYSIVEKSAIQETSYMNVQNNNIGYEDKINNSNAIDNTTFDQSRIPFKHQQIQQQANLQSLISPIFSDKTHTLPFISPTSSHFNILSNNGNQMDSKNTLFLKQTASQQDFKFFSPRTSQVSMQNLIDLQPQQLSALGIEKQQQQQLSNGILSRGVLDSHLSPTQSEAAAAAAKNKFNIDNKMSSHTKQKQSAKKNNLHIYDDNYESQNAPRLREQNIKQRYKKEVENVSNSTPLGVDTKEDKANKKKKLQDIQYEIASTNSKDSSCASAKRQLCSIMDDKSTLSIIKAINIIGILSFATMVCITWVQYISMMNNIKSTYLDYQVFDWPTKYQSTLSEILKYQNAIYLTQLASGMPFASVKAKNDFTTRIRGDMLNNKDIVMNMIIQMESVSTDRKIFSLLREHRLSMALGQYYDLTQISHVSSVPSTLVSVYIDVTIQTSIILSFMHVFRYTADLGKGRPEFYMIRNQLLQISNLKDIQVQMLQIQQNQEIDIQNQLTQLMILIIIITAMCIGIIIPLYYYIQKQRDAIMQLFATFSTSKIDSLLKLISKSYFSIKSLSAYSHRNAQSLKQTLMNLQNSEREKDVRKQNISTITQLPRFNARINIVVVLIYLLIILYPIINKIVTQEFLKKSTLDLETIFNVYQLRSFMLENVGMHFNCLVMKVSPTFKPQNVDIYYDYMKSLIDKNQEISDSIQQIVNDQYESTRYAQPLYDAFFFSAFKDNLCETFDKYPQYNTNSTKINTKICASSYQGFLLKGLQVSYKQFLTVFPELYNMYIIPDAEFLDESIISLKDFILDQNKEYYNYIIAFQIVLISYQMILMLLVFVFGWMHFSRYLNASMHRTKTYLQILDINSLIENSYILTYIKKNSTTI